MEYKSPIKNELKGMNHRVPSLPNLHSNRSSTLMNNQSFNSVSSVKSIGFN